MLLSLWRLRNVLATATASVDVVQPSLHDISDVYLGETQGELEPESISKEPRASPLLVVSEI